MNTKVISLKDDDDDDELKPFYYFEQVVTRRIHHFYLSTIVDAPHKFPEMIFRIQTASQDDAIVIHLNTPGGRIDTGIQLINAMQATPAHVVCSLEGEVASLGTMVFLAADEFMVHDNCMMMFHNYSGAVWGKGHEQIAALDATTKWIENLMRKLYVPFMSEEEFGRIMKGDDLYFHSEEIRKRLKRMVKTLAKEKKEREAAKNTPKPKTRRTSTSKT